MTVESIQIEIPAGLPAWITADLVQQTMAVWQPYYRQVLTVQDAIDIMQAAGRLFQVLASEDRCREAVRRIGSGQQP